MSNFCPEWIFGVCSAACAKEFLSSENSLNSVSRKFAQGLSEKYTEIKFEQITACAEEILQFLSDLEANEDAVTYIESYIYRRMCFKSSGAERIFPNSPDSIATKQTRVFSSTKLESKNSLSSFL